MSDDIAKPEKLSKIDYKPGKNGWMDPCVEFRKGCFNLLSEDGIAPALA